MYIDDCKNMIVGGEVFANIGLSIAVYLCILFVLLYF